MKDKSEKLYTLQLTKPEIATIAAAMVIALRFLDPLPVIVNNDTASVKTFANATITMATNVEEGISIVEKFKTALGGDV
jgi:hypothetical protein